MNPSKSVLFLRAASAFLLPALAAVIAAGDSLHAGLSRVGLVLLVAGSLAAGISGLQSWFDQAYGRASAPGEGLNYSAPQVSIEEQIAAALAGKGFDEASARKVLALDLKAAAALAGISLPGDA